VPPILPSGADDGEQPQTPDASPPSSLSGRCPECKTISRCGFLCSQCGKRVIPFPPQAKPSAQSNVIPY